MTRIETIEMAAQTFVGDGKMLSTDELRTLLGKANSEDERDFYIAVYNFLLARRQKEVMAHESY